MSPTGAKSARPVVFGTPLYAQLWAKARECPERPDPDNEADAGHAFAAAAAAAATGTAPEPSDDFASPHRVAADGEPARESSPDDQTRPATPVVRLACESIAAAVNAIAMPAAAPDDDLDRLD